MGFAAAVASASLRRDGLHEPVESSVAEHSLCITRAVLGVLAGGPCMRGSPSKLTTYGLLR